MKRPKRRRHRTGEVSLRATPRGKGGVALEASAGLPQGKGGVALEAWLLQRWMTDSLDTEAVGAAV